MNATDVCQLPSNFDRVNATTGSDESNRMYALNAVDSTILCVCKCITLCQNIYFKTKTYTSRHANIA